MWTDACMYLGELEGERPVGCHHAHGGSLSEEEGGSRRPLVDARGGVVIEREAVDERRQVGLEQPRVVLRGAADGLLCHVAHRADVIGREAEQVGDQLAVVLPLVGDGRVVHPPRHHVGRLLASQQVLGVDAAHEQAAWEVGGGVRAGTRAQSQPVRLMRPAGPAVGFDDPVPGGHKGGGAHI